MARFFRFPFGTTGTRTAVPDTVQPSGSVSFQEGWGPDYERNPATDAAAKRIPRDQSNQIMYDVTDALRQYQTRGAPEFITSAANGGSAFAYSRNAIVLYSDGNVYMSLADNNTALPTVAASWRLVTPFDLATLRASGADVRAGTSDALLVTPKGFRDAVTIGAGYEIDASGRIHQWGSVTHDANGLGTVVFPIPFNVFHTASVSNAGDQVPTAWPSVGVSTTTGMRVWAARAAGVAPGSAGVTTGWQAWGR